MDQLRFLDIMDTYLSEFELARVSRQFEVDYHIFPGNTKRDRMRGFLGYMTRQTSGRGLAEAIVALRPDLTAEVAAVFEADEEGLTWLDAVARGDELPMESAVTWRWTETNAMEEVANMESATQQSGQNEGRELDEHFAFAKMMATAPPPNPYTPGSRVVDASMFFGRDNELARLLDDLRSGVHIALIGPRLIGCSSLLYHAASRIRESEGVRFLPAIVDLKEGIHQTMPGLISSSWTQWWEQVRPGQSAAVENLAEYVTAVRKLHMAGLKPLLLLDEFDQLAWRSGAFDDSLLDTWFELGREGALTFAVTAHSTPADLLAQGGYRSHFYELFRPVDLGLLEQGAALSVLSVPAQRASLPVPEEAVDYLAIQAGPHPFFLQLAGLYLFESLLRQDFSRPKVVDAFTAAAAPFWQAMWESLSPLAQAHFPTADVYEPTGMAARQLHILANKGLVIEDESGFRPFSEGFATWLARLQAATQSAASVAAVNDQAFSPTPSITDSYPAA